MSDIHHGEPCSSPISKPLPPSSYPEEGGTGVFSEDASASVAEEGPTWVDGIGPPLEQLEEDLADVDPDAVDEGGWRIHTAETDILLLIREVKRLRTLIASSSAEERCPNCDHDPCLRLNDCLTSTRRRMPPPNSHMPFNARSGGDSVTLIEGQKLLQGGGEQKLAVAGAGQLWMHRTPCPHGFTSMRHCTDCLAAKLEDYTGRDEAGELEVRQNELYLAMGLVERMPASETQTACISSMGERMRLLVGLLGKSEVGRSLTRAKRGSASLPEPDASVLEQRLGEPQEKEGLGSASALVVGAREALMGCIPWVAASGRGAAQEALAVACALVGSDPWDWTNHRTVLRSRLEGMGIFGRPLPSDDEMWQEVKAAILGASATANSVGVPDSVPVESDRQSEGTKKVLSGSASALVAEAGHPCPNGDSCALNSGAVHCKHCHRNWPPDAESPRSCSCSRRYVCSTCGHRGEAHPLGEPCNVEDCDCKYFTSTTAAEPSPSPESSRPVSTDREEGEQGVLGASKARRVEAGEGFRVAKTLFDVQDVEVNYYVLVPFTTFAATEWFVGEVASSFDCHVVSRTAVDQHAPLASTSSVDALPENTPLAAEEKVEAREKGLDAGGLQSRPSGGDS